MKIDEMLSAAMDGECTPAELDQLLDGLAEDPAAMQRWQSWSVVQSSMSGVRVGRVSADWSDAVMKAIAMEASPPLTQSLPERGARISRQPSRRRRRSTWAAAGIAASLSVVAVGWLLGGNQATVVDPAPVFAPTVNAVAGQIAQGDEPRVRPVAVSSNAARDDTWLINRYLVEHHQLAGSHGMGSTLRQAQFDGMASHAVYEESVP